MTFQDQYKHPKWQKKRLEVLEANEYTCQHCESTESELHVHHPYYKKGVSIWEYEIHELECLCHKCHKIVHTLDDTIKKRLSLLAPTHKMHVLGYIDSMLGPDLHCEDENYEQGYADGMRHNTKWLIHNHRKVWKE